MLLFLGTGLIAICGTFDFVWACILRHVKTLCTGSTPYRFHPNSYSTRSREKKGGGGGGAKTLINKTKNKNKSSSPSSLRNVSRKPNNEVLLLFLFIVKNNF